MFFSVEILKYRPFRKYLVSSFEIANLVLLIKSKIMLAFILSLFPLLISASIIGNSSFGKQGSENFELQLEPESFGKVRVNVSVDSSQIDVKLTAENSATLAILRASESMLHSISEQNGLKLAEYNVELNNNAQNNEGSNGRKDGKDQKGNLNEGVETMEETLDPLNQDDDVHSLNLIA